MVDPETKEEIEGVRLATRTLALRRGELAMGNGARWVWVQGFRRGELPMASIPPMTAHPTI
ncbi:hypothetical protein TorRG33x02_047530 [Trema orientale]|uniref:Uncharacterized protein n=1 Tax=Trema orientale TaxID=63057 RepID=A0A2P5FP93_TREOI|nr:hypothetical protein TorRG33x02_047530 [Trema orientale]